MLLKPIVTEKSLALAKTGQYTFRVSLGDTKPVIKQAVEKVFAVKVTGVHTAIMAGHAVRRGRRSKPGRTQDWKKAVVKLAAGQKIDLYATT